MPALAKVHLPKEKKMLPVGPLMIEHRLIERMVKLMADEPLKMGKENDPAMGFLDEAVDFIRTYADRCHHGKEEDILFRDLGSKSLSPEHKKTMDDLVREHTWARKTVGRLVGAKERFRQGEKDGLREIQESVKELVEFYPAHIAKEDKHFFIPCMSYFTEKEKDEMLQEFLTFDKNLIYEKYKKMVERFERKYE
jgi:hemerythrin-like domain-containing protein